MSPLNSTQLKLTTKTKVALATFVFSAIIIPSISASAASPELALVSARAEIPGSFTMAQSLHADEKRIYLASAQGTLFVLERNREKNFPILENIILSAPLTAVTGKDNALYVSSMSGAVYTFEIPNSVQSPLKRIDTKIVSDYGIGSLAAVSDGQVAVGLGQARITANQTSIFITGLNPGDDAFMLGQDAKTVLATQPGTVRSYSKASAIYTNEAKNFYTGSVSVFAFGQEIFMTKPGCCGTGIAIYNAANLQQRDTLPILFANTVVKKDERVIVGTEDGKISVYGNVSASYEHEQTLDLRELTRHTGTEDIEIRAVWADTHDGLIFAASSWGNDTSRSNSLPSFFVLEMVEGSQEASFANNSESSFVQSGFVPAAQATGLSDPTFLTAVDGSGGLDDTQVSSDGKDPQERGGFSKIVTGFFTLLSKAFKFLFSKIA